MSNILDEIFSSPPRVAEEDELEGFADGAADVPRSARALQLLADEGIMFSDLIDNVFLGDNSARGHRLVMNARKEAYTTRILPRVMERICQPPDMQIRGKEHIKAIEEIYEWVNKATINTLQRELTTHAKSTQAGDVERKVVSKESLKGLTFDAMAEEVQLNAPKLYNTLLSICETTRQEKNKQKDSKFVYEQVGYLY